jgi:hypothetical protein
MSLWSTAAALGSEAAGTVLVRSGGGLARLQAVIGLQDSGRSLRDQETELLWRVFRDGITLESIRLVEGSAGLFDLTARPFVLGNTIYLKRRDPGSEPALLIHEATHVWQYQHVGCAYASQALGAQFFVESPYRWERELERGRQDWTEFNREAQASFLEDLYTHGCCEFHDEDVVTPAQPTSGAPRIVCGGGIFYDAEGDGRIGRFLWQGRVHTDLARRALAVVRGGPQGSTS